MERLQQEEGASEKSQDIKVVEEGTLELSFANMEGNRYCCGKPGHRYPQCRHKARPRSEWAVNKTPELTKVQNSMTRTNTQQTQSDEASMEQQNNSNVSNPTQAWMGAQVQDELSIAQTRTEMNEWILLDSQSSLDIFCNPNLVEKIGG
jgi:hypothetical protein